MITKKTPTSMYIVFAFHCIIVLSFAIDSDSMRKQVALFSTISLAINLVL